MCRCSLLLHCEANDCLVCDHAHFPPGTNATEAFEDVGHSPDARETQEEYLIGEVDVAAKNRVNVSWAVW